MRLTSCLFFAIALAAAGGPTVAAAGGPTVAATGEETIWFYSAADRPDWCGVTDAAAARAAASSERFASDKMAILRRRADTLASVTVVLQSEDAYVEDTYSFDRDLKVLSLVRRGHYINDPLFSVTYLRDGTGNLALTAASGKLLLRQQKAGRETYFVDWPRYDAFAELPFAKIVDLRSRPAITHRCQVGF